MVVWADARLKPNVSRLRTMNVVLAEITVFITLKFKRYVQALRWNWRQPTGPQGNSDKMNMAQTKGRFKSNACEAARQVGAPIVSEFFGSAVVPTASGGVPPTESLDRN